MDFGHPILTFFYDLLCKNRPDSKKFGNVKSWRKDRSSRFSCHFIQSLHLTTTRGRSVKKCLGVSLKNQYSNFHISCIKSILGMGFKEVAHNFLIKDRSQKLWPKTWFFLKWRSMKVRYFALE